MGSVVRHAQFDVRETSIGVAELDRGVSNHIPIRDSSGSDLAWKFFALGKLTGKSATEIIAGVGRPTSRRSMANGQTLLQWQATGYRMALLFNGDERAVRIAAESQYHAPRLEHASPSVGSRSRPRLSSQTQSRSLKSACRTPEWLPR